MITDGNVTIMVKNMDKSIKFYTELLRFKLKYRVNNHWAEVGIKGLTIGIHPNKEKNNIGSMSIGLNVKDIKKEMKVLEKKNIKFNFHDEGFIKLAHFEDPDGNKLYLCQYDG